MSASSFALLSLLVEELGLPSKSIAAVIQLFSEGNTIPFIARYRKEVTGNLDEVQIRTIQERFTYLNELEDRRKTILSSIESQGKLSDELKELILTCQTKTALEDLYLPYKPKRRTRAMIAREKGLEPLAVLIFQQPLNRSPSEDAKDFVDADKGVPSIDEALAGARDIAAEMIAENAEARGMVRELFNSQGMVCSKVIKGKDQAPTKFEQYYDFQERVSEIPSHRYLAIRRGETEEILECKIEIEEGPAIEALHSFFKLNKASLYCKELEKACEDGLKRLLLPSIETDVRVELKMKSDRAAVDVFAENLRNLLLSSPLGGRSVIGIDPGIRTGCKCTAVDETGKYLDALTIYPYQGERQQEQARLDLMRFIIAHKPFAIGIGNGTAGRETESFVRKLLADANRKDIIIVPVSEAGASVYSASDIAREEFPDLDLTLRGAISIARRLQDPLAELVKIDPKAIGVGQYQHDVYQQLLQDKLSEVVESCVNHVGVELNTASAPLLSYVAGIGSSLASKIVKYRELHGAFKSRKQLLDVPGLGPKTFEQAAGFLRVRGGSNPLDASAVHPERYELVERIAQDMGTELETLVANQSLADKIDGKKYVSANVGMLTLTDIIAELKKPGRDPRASFERPAFREDVMSIKDLKAGMKLEGIVTNVAAFGVFVDIGVHQDGFIHISELADRFIKDPSEVMRVGDKVKVEVLGIDTDRNRISLSAKTRREQKIQGKAKPVKSSFGNNPFASL
jgi:uncharacterized protein